ncbi:DUF427 domain-containing protein [Halomonas saccharevitans]|uniref:DUF427 domain-containing protein n=1 Tax=Halomonas saccharevitans TaxID=416872 RepID=A0ABU3NFW1_9GAMM|nr:DUF427 domain-containing protein [Halomonas saccharevitans]MDT8879495.1 DUF427 domain-containing protein [Halomonas saccharevitans]
MADQITESRIPLHPQTQIRGMCIFAGDTASADTCEAIALSECGYPQREYTLRTVVDVYWLGSLPQKGQYDVLLTAGVAWSYERTIDEMKSTADSLAFDAGKFTKHMMQRVTLYDEKLFWNYR